MRILSKIIIFLIALQCTPAAAQIRPFVSGALVYAKVNEMGVGNRAEPSFSYGLFAKKDKVISSLSTNRGIEQISSRKTNTGLVSRSKATSDNLLIGYAFNRFAPSLIISNTRVKKRLENGDRILAEKSLSAILTGANFTYFITPKISVSTFYIMPSSKLNLNYAVGTSLNLIF